MSAIYAIHALAATPIFAARGFLAAFLVALFARFGADLPFVEHLWASQLLTDAPGWLTGNVTLALLGVLAVGESMADKQPEMREMMGMVDRYGKPVLYVAVMMGFLGEEGRVLMGTGGSEVVAAGFGDVPVVWGATAVGTGLVWWLTRERNSIRSRFKEGDPEDESGVQGILSWLEDYGVSVGAFVLVFMPLIALALAVLAIAGMAMLRLWVLRRERKRRRDCSAGCGRKVQPAALCCPGCGEGQEGALRLGWLGTTRAGGPAVKDTGMHRLELIRWKRCPNCAEPLPRRDVVQTCKECGKDVFPRDVDAERYLDHVRAQLPKTLLVCFLMSLVPVVGLVTGVIYYRLSLIPGLKRYLPLGTAMVGQWVVRILCFVVLWFQAVPVIGAFSVPIMCLVNYLYYRRLFERRLEKSEWPETAALEARA